MPAAIIYIGIVLLPMAYIIMYRNSIVTQAGFTFYAFPFLKPCGLRDHFTEIRTHIIRVLVSALMDIIAYFSIKLTYF